jgi:hypothetical protein
MASAGVSTGGGSGGRRAPATQRPTVVWAARNGGTSGSSGGSTQASSHGTYGSSESSSTVGRAGRSARATTWSRSHSSRGTSSASWLPVPTRKSYRSARPSRWLTWRISRRAYASASPSSSLGTGASGTSTGWGLWKVQSNRPSCSPSLMVTVRSAGVAAVGTGRLTPASCGGTGSWPARSARRSTASDRTPSPTTWPPMENWTWIRAARTLRRCGSAVRWSTTLG